MPRSKKGSSRTQGPFRVPSTPSTSEDSQSIPDPSSLRISASDSDVSRDSTDFSPRSSKKRKSGKGYATPLCNLCPEKDEKIKELTSHLEQLRLEVDTAAASRQAEREYEELKSRYNEMEKKYQAEREAKENALTRLSGVLSSTLRDNNPNIADLSDEYRPDKLKNLFSEIYDNEWTDAYEVLERNGLEDEDIIRQLLDIVMFVSKRCQTIADENLEKLKRLLSSPCSEVDESNSSEIKDITVFKGMKDYRKTQAIHTFKDVLKVIEGDSKWDISVMEVPEVKAYFSACVKICWLASVQDPPVVLHIDENPAPKFDSRRFTEYTERGRYVKFFVWPALLLHEAGPLMNKGVAQGTNTQPPRRR